MSGSARQIAGGIAGAFVGFWLGNPALGYAIGSALFAPGPESGPAPDAGDLSFSTSAYGKFMPWGYGGYKSTPVSFWSTDFVAHHHSEEVGGKGGGGGATREWITYTRSFAMYLRDCTDGEEITGIRRIWNKFTGELLYDVSDTASAETLVASSNMAAKIRVYTGSTTQDPDPLIEAHEGWAPAHRGHAYMVIEDFDHGETKQAAPLEVEIATVAGDSPLLVNSFSLGADEYFVKYEDGIAYTLDMSDTGPTATVKRRDLSGNLLGQDAPRSVGAAGSFLIENLPDAAILYSGGKYYYEGTSVSQFLYVTPTAYSLFGLSAKLQGVAQGSAVYSNGKIFITWRYSISPWTRVLSVYNLYDERPITYYVLGTGTSTPYDYVTADDDGYIYVWTTNSKTVRKFDSDLNLLDSWGISQSNLSYQFSVRNGKAAWTYSISTPKHAYIYELDPAAGSATLFGAVEIPSTRVTSLGSVRIVDDSLLLTDAGAVAITDLYADSGSSLPTVAANLCARAGLTADQYDTSLLPATGVRQAITGQRAARDWLAELGQIFGFRMRDSAGVLEFVPKGQASVATIAADELGLQEPPKDPAPPPINVQRTQGNDLPRAVTVSYSSADADYAPGAQPYRMHNYVQGREVAVRTSHILTDQAAFDYAYIACKEPHLERLSWSTSVGLDRLALEPGDVVTLPSGDAWIREIHQRGGTVLELTLQAEAASAYTAPSLPAPTQSSPPVAVKLAGPTRLEILDAPAILDSHTGAGYLVAACGYLSGWSGCALYLSTDGGESYSRFMSLNTAAVIGTAVDALGDGAPGALDRSNSVTIQLTSGSLASVSLANLYAGQNTALLGDELIKFANVEFLGDNQYRLSILERGRKGTEWATADHAAGERFVLLNTAVQRIPLSTDDLSKARLIKAVSYGNDIGDVSPQSFTPAGVSLLPWPPTRARAYQSGSDWIIQCNERTRFGGELRNYVGITRDPEWDGWDLDIMNGAAVVRAITGLSSPTYTYTAAMQTTDFGSAQSSITYRWYQRSTVMGRGYVTETTT